ncbi:hypothetical protein Dgeo_3056 (plasmid) [Deinococcus geothermalis DSM 11300]|uniref:Uncharacterized protein n=1 Tax=Deinococcus geothermalis (strain DSM 11300 / CIP 105573 / AG-3a) TaxID=319795 RepID=A8ZRI8_DEIGD|nr:hypothetical protein Dgeo_3056 [Deinococcus geothermalis DSM 11300]
MSLPTSLIVDLPSNALAKASTDPSGRRMVYFEASRDGTVDREGEMVAADGLWASRELMLSQGDFDISHFAHLPSSVTGRPQPEYRIGHPTQVTRQGKSIFVAGEIYRSGEGVPAPGKDGKPWWPDYFWHSIAEQNPPAKWFPSVYGKINPGGIEIITVKGQQVRRIISVQWYSVGFALRAQHPDLGPVSLSPVGNLLAKADHAGLASRASQAETLHLPWRAFAKSVSEVGQIVTDHAALTGVQALTKQSLDRRTRKQVAAPDAGRAKLRVKALRALQSGLVDPTRQSLTRFFRREGLGQGEAETLASALLRDIAERSRN